MLGQIFRIPLKSVILCVIYSNKHVYAVPEAFLWIGKPLKLLHEQK